MEKSAKYTKTALLAGAAISMALLAAPLYAQSKLTHYSDVAAGAWYEGSARALLDIGALEADEPLLRPNALATRAEMVKLLVRVNDETLHYPPVPSFVDVGRTAWYFPYFETSAQMGWVRGDKDCYGTRPCYARPNSNLNRAEAAALLVRAFALTSTGDAPTFMDNANRNTWYYQSIQTAADHCILQGDDDTSLVRPASTMNRAEMVVMFHRAYQNLDYGDDCASQTTAEISSAIALTSRKVRLVFSTDLEASRADDASRYSIHTIAGAKSIDVASATVVGTRTVDLVLDEDLTGGVLYRATASALRTSGGFEFSSSRNFNTVEFSPGITSGTATASNRIRLVFNTDIDSSTANDAFRFAVRETGNSNATIGVQSAIIVDSKTIDLALSSSLRANISYLVTANDLLTTNNTEFSDNITLTFGEATANLDSITSVGSNTLRLVFNTNLDRGIAETTANYRVMSNNRDISITNARFIDARTYELTLGETLQSQRTYVVYGNNLRTSGGVQFSDTGSTVYSGGSVSLTASLIGAREVPPVVTTMIGSGSFTLTSTGLQYTVTISGASGTGAALTGAHFHRGAIGINGPVIHAVVTSPSATTLSGTWSNLTEQDRNDLLNGNIYFNVHTERNPNGEIRGQVTQ